jgi:acyl-CoA synthetase (NDP forming)
MNYDQGAVRAVLDQVKADGRSSLSAPEAKKVCDAYDIPVPKEGLVVKGFDTIIANAKDYKAGADIAGVQVQQMLPQAQEVIVGAVTDQSFGKVVAFGLGGVLVEVLKDVTFRLAPTNRVNALSMIDGIGAAEILRGVRGAPPVDREALVSIIINVSQLVDDFPEISEIDLNPVFARADGATAVDVRVVVDFSPPEAPFRPSQEEILSAMKRIMEPDSVAVIGASSEEGKIGNSVMKNLINGGYQGEIYPINPRADEILGRKCYKSVKDIEGEVDIAVFAIPAKFVVAGAIMIPSGFAETGEVELQNEMLAVARKHNVRVMGPNIYGFYYTPKNYGFYYTPKNLCATFCTPYDVAGKAALSSQSGGVGMSIIGFSRSTKMGVSAIVGLGNKSDLDEDDLLTFFEQDDNTDVIAMHVEDLKDGRNFAEVAERVSKKKPVVVLKAGRTASGARAAASHTAALAGNDQIYDDILRQSGVVRAMSLNDMLQFARGLPKLPTPRGENVVIITGAGGSGVLLSDACVDNGLELMEMPDDLDKAFRQFIPPFGAAGNPVDITGGEPPLTYRNTIKLGLEDDRIDALILGYWHTIVTPPMVFAELLGEVVEECRAKGIHKPVVASLVGDVAVEEASEYLYERDIVAYPYTTELPVAVLGAKYRWARGAGLL